MSVWGKVIGGVAGFALGGPLGALIGAYAGHKMDRAREGEQTYFGSDDVNQQTRQVAFTMAVIVLSAKMAKADGVVTREEIEAFKHIFHIPLMESKSLQQQSIYQSFFVFYPQIDHLVFHLLKIENNSIPLQNEVKII